MDHFTLSTIATLSLFAGKCFYTTGIARGDREDETLSPESINEDDTLQANKVRFLLS